VKLRARINDSEPLELNYTRDGELYRFRLGEVPERKAHVVAVESGIYSVLVDGRSYAVKIVQGQGTWFVDIRGRHLAVKVDDPRDASEGSGEVATQGLQKIVAQMPGKVVRVLVAQGDEVQAGQGLVVVEAMKMQNELKAPRAGRIASLLTREGATVLAGEVLATLE
jgi:biotin carboxyl carrier protein